MSLDIPTLFLVSILVTSLLGLLLLGLWLQDRSSRALGYWGAAYLLGAVAVALWVAIPDELLHRFDVATALLLFCCGLIWNGARAFHGRAIKPWVAGAGAVLWLIASELSLLSAETVRIAVSSVVIAVYAVLTAVELQRERRKRPAEKRRYVSPILHGMIFLSPILTTTLYAGSPNDHIWVPFFALLMLLYVVGTAVIVIVMTKEHAVQVHKTAAMTDPMTGLFNRRGFHDAAERLIAAQRQAGQAVTVMMFDLDHFKSINDRFGHDVGDAALKVFATTASGNLRKADVLGRLGGEEFAAILPGGGETAMVVGERVRAAFQSRGVEIAGHFMNATVSIGAVDAMASAADISTMLTQADEALYAAKAHGRNRVCTYKDIPAEKPARPQLPDLTSLRPKVEIPHALLPAV